MDSIAFGCPFQAIVVAYGLDERTVMNWQECAGKLAQRVHKHLVEQPRDLEHLQADEIRGKVLGKALWLGAVVSPRQG